MKTNNIETTNQENKKFKIPKDILWIVITVIITTIIVGGVFYFSDLNEAGLLKKKVDNLEDELNKNNSKIVELNSKIVELGKEIKTDAVSKSVELDKDIIVGEINKISANWNSYKNENKGIIFNFPNDWELLRDETMSNDLNFDPRVSSGGLIMQKKDDNGDLLIEMTLSINPPGRGPVFRDITYIIEENEKNGFEILEEMEHYLSDDYRDQDNDSFFIGANEKYDVEKYRGRGLYSMTFINYQTNLADTKLIETVKTLITSFKFF